MVGVPAATLNAQYGGIGSLSALVPEYLIDRHEVTNRDFKTFVDAGGYTTRAYWTEPFVDGDRTLSWEDAMRRFVDPTGRTGPATWDGGVYKDGEDDAPVAGVSWYEAAAYAAFAGRSLPTVYHWFRAANTDDSRFLVALSNFSGKGPAAVGRSNAIGSFGPVDMAGNVREWCWNATGPQRYLLGGSWADPAYMLTRGQLAPPLDRSMTNGFRCARYSSVPLSPSLTDPIIPVPPPAYLSAAPASDDAFEIYRSMYAYDPADVNAVVESENDDAAQWRRETVRIKAAYGDETMLAYVFVPKNHKPPYACVIDVPSDVAFQPASGATIRPDSYVLTSGRAMVYPIFKGTFERYSERPSTDPIAIRDYLVMWRKDLGRTLDYLQTRTDIDPSKIAYLGHSTGAEIAPMLLATEPRVSVAILLSGGLGPFFGKLPEINAINFLPRVRIPVLMVNGAYDSILPVATSQEPMFQRLGTSPAQKRHVVFKSGHAVTVPEVRNDLVREVMAWLDTYLGKT
jgi:predicted esterase